MVSGEHRWRFIVDKADDNAGYFRLGVCDASPDPERKFWSFNGCSGYIYIQGPQSSTMIEKINGRATGAVIEVFLNMDERVRCTSA